MNSDEAEDFIKRLLDERKSLPAHRRAKNWLKWNVWTPIKGFPRSVKWRVQRARRGYSDYDLWGADTYLAKLNIAMLRDMAKDRHGHPMGLSTEHEFLTDDEAQTIRDEIAAIDAEIGFEGSDGDGMGRWLAMLEYFAQGWEDYLRYVESYDLEAFARFKKMMVLYAEWHGGLWI
jgi:hypothetical protein